MKGSLILALLLSALSVLSQKPPVTFLTARDWPAISEETISNNGEFLSYVVWSERDGRSVFVGRVDSGRRFVYERPNGPFVFTMDSRWGLCLYGGDTLLVLDLIKGRERSIGGVGSFKVPEGGDGRWLGYLSKDSLLRLVDLFSGKEHIYSGVRDFMFSASGAIVLIETADSVKAGQQSSLRWVDLRNNVDQKIWSGKDAGHFAFDKTRAATGISCRVGFGGEAQNAIWYYRSRMDIARCWIREGSAGADSNFVVAGREPKFSGDGSMLFFFLNRTRKLPVRGATTAAVNVWRYGSDFLQPVAVRRWEDQRYRAYMAVVAVGDSTVRRLQPDMALFVELSGDAGVTKAVFSTDVNVAAGYRNLADRPDIYIENTRDGKMKKIAGTVPNAEPHFSPEGRYVYWYDARTKTYFSYDVHTEIVRNISAGVTQTLYDAHWDKGSAPAAYGVACWLAGDAGMLVYDHYDIWQLDPVGKEQPICLTNGFGRKSGTRLRWVYYDVGATKQSSVKTGDRVVLSGFNEVTRYNGFFQLTRLGAGIPEKLIMAPELLYFPEQLDFGIPASIHKARDTDLYVLTRMSATEFPNLQVTNDFRHFRPLTNLEPQKSYNWLTSELFHWRAFDGAAGDAILYKPENFDPHKKYPVIFCVYERLTAGLNKFLTPDLSAARLNIPWFVSNGYVVLCPDIYYKIGAPAKSIYNYVVSAVEAIGREPWVNKAAIGIQGHSWGGFEVNSLITSTGVFAAACSAEGASDLVSASANAESAKADPFGFVEQETYRMGSSIWADRTGYVKNSPVYWADKVHTPLLLVDNRNDRNVPWGQGVEMFMALDRLGKQVWLLEYDGEAHMIRRPANQLDFSIRLSQFFDHFLKGAPSPVWMTHGIPPSLKGIDSGFEPDTRSSK